MNSIENKLVKIINAKSTLVTIICGESSGFIMLSQQLRNMIFFFFLERVSRLIRVLLLDTSASRISWYQKLNLSWSDG